MAKKSISTKLSAVLLGMVAISAIIIGLLSFFLFRSSSIDSSALRMQNASQAVASMIDPDDYKAVMESGEKTELYEYVQQCADEIKTQIDATYLYVIDKNVSVHEGEECFHYFMDTYSPGDSLDDMLDLWDYEAASLYPSEIYTVLQTGEPATTDLYLDEYFGVMVSGFAPVLDKDGTLLAVVGSDLIASDVMASVTRYAWMISLLTLVFFIPCAILCRYIAKRFIGRPLAALTQVSEKVSRGDIDVEIDIHTEDEIGQLAGAFRNMIENTQRQANILERLAEKDLTMDIQPQCEADVMSHSLKKMVENLRTVFYEIHNGAAQMATGAAQMADGAQLLAQGATEQEITISHLSEAIDAVTAKTDANAQMAERAAELALVIKESAEKGSSQMHEMQQAVSEIDAANRAIGKVMKIIDDIAFQTNILALNAAVEAARAGQYGKGFAVVADEVRNLAAKSANSAKDTAALIEDSITKAELGVRITQETSQSLDKIVSGVNESSDVISSIYDASGAQSMAIRQINQSMNEFAQVVQQNSATAEESAAASEEMSSQAAMLDDMLGEFRLKKNDTF